VSFGDTSSERLDQWNAIASLYTWLRILVILSKEFFDLQLTFAERVHALSGIPLEHALLDYTNIYVRLGLGFAFDYGNEAWRAYLDGLRVADDGYVWTYAAYLRNVEADAGPPLDATVGCFAYAMHDAHTARLHFYNCETDDRSPLSLERAAVRRAELADLVGHLNATADDYVVVVGLSWLYNLDAYRRLFPSCYGDSRRPIGGRFRSMSLWGQFVDHRGRIKEAVATQFLSALDACSSIDRLDHCFP
jgi:hypothetical protein